MLLVCGTSLLRPYRYRQTLKLQTRKTAKPYSIFYLPRSLLETKKQARSGGGLSGLLAKSSGEEEKIDLCFTSTTDYFVRSSLAVVGWFVSPTVLVISRTSTRRLSARPCFVLLLSTGLSLPNPIT